MTQTYFTKTVIGPQYIVVTSMIAGAEVQAVVNRGLAEDQDMATATIAHKVAADRAFGTSTEQQIQQRQGLNKKVETAGFAVIDATL